jgi:ribosomal protein S17E
MKPLRNTSGTVSQMVLPIVTARGVLDKEKDIFASIFMENKRIVRKVPVYKYVMHKNNDL